MASTTTNDPIRRGEVYTKAQFLSRTGMREAAYRTARRSGLSTVETAGRVFISGDAWFQYLESLTAAKAEPATA